MIKLTKPSVSEKDYIIAGCNDKIRNDGRDIHDFRSILIENNIFPHTNGSSRLKIGNNTDLVCSVKVEILEATPGIENDLTQGTIEVSVDISPSCQLKHEDRKITEFSNILGQQIQRMYMTSVGLDLKSLCIIPNKFVWAIYVDIIVTECDCDLLQCCSIAAYVALQNTRVPRVEVLTDETGQLADFELSSNIDDVIFLNVDNLPIYVNAYKIGRHLVLDVTGDEQGCATSSLCVAVRQRQGGQCCDIVKQQTGALALTDIPSAIKLCREGALAIFKIIATYMQNEDSISKDSTRYSDMVPLGGLGYLA